jgi:hypothetical protein
MPHQPLSDVGPASVEQRSHCEACTVSLVWLHGWVSLDFEAVNGWVSLDYEAGVRFSLPSSVYIQSVNAFKCKAGDIVLRRVGLLVCMCPALTVARAFFFSWLCYSCLVWWYCLSSRREADVRLGIFLRENKSWTFFVSERFKTGYKFVKLLCCWFCKDFLICRSCFLILAGSCWIIVYFWYEVSWFGFRDGRFFFCFCFFFVCLFFVVFFFCTQSYICFAKVDVSVFPHRHLFVRGLEYSETCEKQAYK